MFTDYKPSRGYDEYFCNEQAQPRTALLPLLSSLGRIGLDELNRSHASAGNLLRRLGATFRTQPMRSHTRRISAVMSNCRVRTPCRATVGSA